MEKYEKVTLTNMKKKKCEKLKSHILECSPPLWMRSFSLKYILGVKNVEGETKEIGISQCTYTVYDIHCIVSNH